LLCNFVLECPIRKVEGNQKGSKLNGTHKLLVYADDVSIMGDNINTAALLEAGKEVGLK
jgi:hypothetical protein